MFQTHYFSPVTSLFINHDNRELKSRFLILVSSSDHHRPLLSQMLWGHYFFLSGHSVNALKGRDRNTVCAEDTAKNFNFTLLFDFLVGFRGAFKLKEISNSSNITPFFNLNSKGTMCAPTLQRGTGIKRSVPDKGWAFRRGVGIKYASMTVERSVPWRGIR